MPCPFLGFYITIVYVSSNAGNQNAILVQADANIIYFGLNCTHWTGPGWSAFKTQTLYPVSAFQTCTLPSVDPLKMNCESGLNEASIGIPLLFKCPVKVCKGVPWKASTKRIIEPFVLIKIVFPSLENFKPVQSHSFSWVSLNVTKGPWNVKFCHKLLFCVFWMSTFLCLIRNVSYRTLKMLSCWRILI